MSTRPTGTKRNGERCHKVNLWRDVILKNTDSMLDVVLQLVAHCAFTSSAIMLSCVVDMCFQINTPRWAHFVCIIISILGFLGLRKSNRAGLFYSAITGAFVFLLELMFAALLQAAYTNDALRALLLTVGGLFAVLAIGTIYDRHRGRKPRLLAYFLDAQWVCCIILAFFVSQLGTDAAIKINDALSFQKAYEQQYRAQQEQLEIQIPAFSLDDYTDELLVLLDDKEWANMASPDKLTVLELVLEEEVSYFGLPFELTLTYQDDLPEHTYGSYVSQAHEILISPSAINDPVDAVDTICHEVHHAYAQVTTECYGQLRPEYRNLLPFQHVPDYIKEYSDYKNCDGIENLDKTQADKMFQAYASQALEQDARSYAAEACERIFTKLADLTGQSSS